MRETVLFIAVSLDGYIADRAGRVDWIDGQSPEEEMKDSYGAFVQEMDTVIMGWNTYHQIVTELSPGQWVYEELTSYVVTHREAPSTEKIRFTREDPGTLLRRLREQPGKGIWICGGAQIARQLLAEDLIDRLYLSVIPTLLGGGVRLFGELERERKLRLVGTETYNGIVELIYERRTGRSC